MVKHQDMARKANLIAEYLEKESFSESIDVGDYMKATEDLQAMHFSFKDVELLLFKPKFNVLLNLVALHHCIVQLELPVSIIIYTFLSFFIVLKFLALLFFLPTSIRLTSSVLVEFLHLFSSF